MLVIINVSPSLFDIFSNYRVIRGGCDHHDSVKHVSVLPLDL